MSQRTVDTIRFESASPVFHVSDVATALAFYCDGLGFKDAVATSADFDFIPGARQTAAREE
jgi:catechol 2,3-dioxygenase-like lactoylglutathione lyase family enzyme